MKTTCIIDNYNYSRYLNKAVESALNQSVSFDEIIIVDDGSTDQSVEIIRDFESRNKKIKAIIKENGGQLSAFNRGYEESSGEIIAFLDADDYYDEDFLMEMLHVFERFEDVDHIFCDSNIVDQNNEHKYIKERYRYKKDIHFGKTIVKTYSLFSWTGNSTSMNIFRRRILDKFLPLDMENTFRISADRPVVMGVSLAGGSKYYLKRALVNYRIHGDNLYQGNKKSKSRYYEYQRRLVNEDMFQKLLKKMDMDSVYLNRLLLEEYLSKPSKTLRETMTYLYIVLMGQYAVFNKLGMSVRILSVFLFQKNTAR